MSVKTNSALPFGRYVIRYSVRIVASMSGALNKTWAGVTRGVVVIERSSSHVKLDTRTINEVMLAVFFVVTSMGSGAPYVGTKTLKY